MKSCCVCVSYLLIFAAFQIGTSHFLFAQSNESWAPGRIEGTVFLDVNEDGIYDVNDAPISSMEVQAFEDVNFNGQIDDTDPLVSNYYTDNDGTYFMDVYPTDIKSVKINVDRSTDDAVQNEPGGIMILDGAQESGVREIGIRFNNLNIPQGAEILSAKLTMTAASPSTGISEVIVSAEDSDNAGTFTTESYNIYNRPRTSAVIAWHSGEPVSTNDLMVVDGIESVVTEVINRNGWASGNSMVLIVADFFHDIYTFDGGFAPQLSIVYKDPSITKVDYIVRPMAGNQYVSSRATTNEKAVVSMTEFDTHKSGIDFGFTEEAVVLANEEHAFGNSSINVFPNPTTGPVTIGFNGDIRPANFDIKVYDLQGKVAAVDQVYVDHATQAGYDLSPLAKGTYIMEISSDDLHFTQKVILH